MNTASQKGVQLFWSNIAGEDGYNIYRDGNLLTKVGVNVSGLFDEQYPMRPGTEYCVEAFNGDGVSPQCCVSAFLGLSPATVSSLDWYQDCFPTDETAGLPGTAGFDVAPARVGTGRNIAPLTGNAQRHNIAAPGARLTPVEALSRVDLVFRVLPGVGNYAVPGDPSSGLTTVPGGPLIAPGDGSFWSNLIAAPGTYATGTQGTNGVPHPLQYVGQPWSQRWDPATWNSRECAFVGGAYVTDGIIPSDLLTPGAIVEYFFRMQGQGNPLAFVLNLPDTSLVLQMTGQGSIDGHRWEHFSVLPDEWKNPAFGGLGSARALVVDLDDGGGNERIWKGIADSIGATAPAKYGAGTGWHAVGNGADIDDPLQNRLNDNVTPGFISAPLGQPGTTWDLYNVRGGGDLLNGNAGSLGGRLANRAGLPVWTGEDRLAPTPEMLRTYYRQLIIFTGSRHHDILGPFNDRGQNDVAMLNDFLANVAPSGTQPRGIFIEGDGFVESEMNALPPGANDHIEFITTKLCVVLRDGDYRVLSENWNSAVHLETQPPHTPAFFEMQSNADNDVLQRNGTIPEAQTAAYWEDTGVNGNGPFAASIYKPSAFLRPWVALTDGWNIEHLGTGKGFVCQGCVRSRPDGAPTGAERTLTSHSRLAYFFETLTDIFGSIAPVAGSPSSTIDVPRDQHPEAFFRLLNNPLESGEATLRFVVPAADHVEVTLYDPLGRRVRKLVERDYPAGTWDAVWDGRDDAGHPLGRGVYFARVRLARGGIQAAKKLVMLR